MLQILAVSVWELAAAGQAMNRLNLVIFLGKFTKLYGLFELPLRKNC